MKEEKKEEQHPEETAKSSLEPEQDTKDAGSEHHEQEKESSPDPAGKEETNDSSGESIEDLKAKMEELETKLADYENRYLRLLADFENFRRRIKKEKEADEKYRAQSLITNLLPALDNFERAMQIEPDNEQTKALLDGVSMVYKSIIEALKDEGAEQIEAVGKEFDPNLHQAVAQAEVEGAGENIVVEEFQKGYILKGRVIRPSMVKVNK
jgi:molecular chaperone GrpE